MRWILVLVLTGLVAGPASATSNPVCEEPPVVECPTCPTGECPSVERFLSNSAELIGDCRVVQQVCKRVAKGAAKCEKAIARGLLKATRSACTTQECRRGVREAWKATRAGLKDQLAQDRAACTTACSH